MSLKIKFDDVMWAPSVDNNEYSYADLDCSFSSAWGYANTTLEMSIHPEWLMEMGNLKIGDLVTTHEGDVGIVSDILPIEGLEMKKFEVNVGGKTDIFFSINLKKLESKNEKQ